MPDALFRLLLPPCSPIASPPPFLDFSAEFPSLFYGTDANNNYVRRMNDCSVLLAASSERRGDLMTGSKVSIYSLCIFRNGMHSLSVLNKLVVAGSKIY